MSEVAIEIAGEIQRRGSISFHRFMELALYCPVCGYYEKEEDRVGKRGDFYTSVSVGSLFGELLGFQFSEWLNHLRMSSPHLSDGTSSPFEIVEAGAHDGALARDILSWLRDHRPEMFSGLRYLVVEPSARRRSWQQRRLSGWGEKVVWVEDLDALASRGKINGIIFSNELLDSFPVHRLGWDKESGKWFEWAVRIDGGGFTWCRQGFSRSGLGEDWVPKVSEELLKVLPDQFTIEVCPAASGWWRNAACSLNKGILVTFDYGLDAEEFFQPSRAQGTLRAYRGHQLTGDVLSRPGEQDLTAHVDFSALRSAGEIEGLRTAADLTQEAFLARIVERTCLPGGEFGEWTPSRVRQLQTLTNPAHLGRAFRVLAQQTPPLPLSG